jgi:hypothetical protein
MKLKRARRSSPCESGPNLRVAQLLSVFRGLGSRLLGLDHAIEVGFREGDVSYILLDRSRL